MLLQYCKVLRVVFLPLCFCAISSWILAQEDEFNNDSLITAGTTLTFDQTAVTMSYTANTYKQEATKTEVAGDTGSISYTSSDTNIATVDTNTGIVTFKAAGTVIITASKAKTPKKYQSSKATYTLTISIVTLPNGVNAIMLGDTKDIVLEKLRTSTLFEAYNPPEISVIPNTTKQMLRITGKIGVDNRYIMEAVFQFKKIDTAMKLVTISLFLNKKLLDYYTMYATHYKKYGRAQSISTTQAIWENETVRVILEKPLNIKYISRVFSDPNISTINTEQRIQKRQKEREDFLSLF